MVGGLDPIRLGKRRSDSRPRCQKADPDTHCRSAASSWISPVAGNQVIELEGQPPRRGVCRYCSFISSIRSKRAGHLRQSVYAPRRLPSIEASATCAVGSCIGCRCWRVRSADEGDFRKSFSITSSNGQIEVGAIEVLGGGESADRFAKSLTDEFVRLLALNGIHAIARDASRQSNAELELRGSVDQSNDDYIVRADIVSRPHQMVLWSTTMQRDLHESVNFQQQISTLVADVVECALHTRSQLRNEPLVDTFALLFRSCAAQIGASPPEQLAETSRLILEAIPDDPLAYAGCAGSNAFVSALGPYKSRSASTRDCAKSSTNAHQQHKRWVRDQDFGALHSVSSMIRREISSNGKPTFALALDMDPDCRRSRRALAMLLDNVGRIREARVENERWPTSTRINGRRTKIASSSVSAAELGRMDIARPSSSRSQQRGAE